MQPTGDQVFDPVHSFPLAIDRQQAGAYHLLVLLFGQVSPYDHINDAVLVFQGQEDGPAGRGWALAHRDQAGGAQAGSMAPSL